MYRLGEINGVAHMKNTQLFQTYIQTKDELRKAYGIVACLYQEVA